MPLALALLVGITLCSDSPGDRSGKWLYRIIDGHKCWFQAEGLRRGREKPRDELQWPKYEPEPEEGSFKSRWPR